MTIKSPFDHQEKIIYELNNKMIEQHEINKIDVDQLKAVEVLTNQAYIRKKYPKVKDDDLTLIRLSTEKENDLVPLPIIEKTPFTATVKSRDFTSVEFGNSITYNSHLEYIKDWLGGETFIIELDGELKPEMTFVDINHMDGLKIQTFEIIKNDKMYDYHKKRKLKGYDALIRIVTK